MSLLVNSRPMKSNCVKSSSNWKSVKEKFEFTIKKATNWWEVSILYCHKEATTVYIVQNLNWPHIIDRGIAFGHQKINIGVDID